jgi:lipopolysaccharide export LptBFGC system permease protein LptF
MDLTKGRIITLNEDDRHSTINFNNFKLNTPLLDADKVSFKSERLMKVSDLVASFDKGNDYKFEFSKRVSMPFASFIMGIFGMSLGIFFHRSGKTMAIPITIGVVAVYNIMFFSVQSLASSGRVEPFFAAWIPNIVFAVLAFFAYRRAL